MKLNLGSANVRIEGYTNLDIYPFENVDILHDIEKRLPFENDSIEEIYCHHALEHCSMEAISSMLKDWNRVLKTDGKIRIITPEINSCMKKFLETPESDSNKWGYMIEYILGGQHHQEGQQFHKSAYTVERLKNLVENSGFKVDEIHIINNGRNDAIHLVAFKK